MEQMADTPMGGRAGTFSRDTPLWLKTAGVIR